jgi:hypothetical protein
MKRNPGSTIFIIGVISIVVSIILLYIVEQAQDFATAVLVPAGSILLLLGSFIADRKQ